MDSYFIDTNILLRFLLKDHKLHYPLARKIFKKAEEGKISIWITDVVILEVIWTLKSLYKYGNTTIREKIDAIISLPNIEVKNKNMLIQALHDFATQNIDFADAYNFQLAQKVGKKILSFDEDFKKLGLTGDIEKVAKL